MKREDWFVMAPEGYDELRKFAYWLVDKKYIRHFEMDYDIDTMRFRIDYDDGDYIIDLFNEKVTNLAESSSGVAPDQSDQRP